MKIIALGHRKYVGKDTAAQCLIDEGWVQLSFAEPLKRTVACMFNIDMKYFTDQSLKDKVIPFWGKTPRDMLLWFGSEVVRKIDDKHWIKNMHINILSCVFGTYRVGMPERSDVHDSGILDIYDCLKGVPLNTPAGAVIDDKSIKNHIKGIVITDCRFPNELEYLRNIGATTINISRKSVPMSNDIADSALPDDAFEYQVCNDSTVEELWANIKSIAYNTEDIELVTV